MSDAPAPAQEVSPELRGLAEDLGVSTEFWDWRGVRHEAPASTLVAVLAALGVDASTPERASVARWLRAEDRWRRTLPPVVMSRPGWTPWFWVHVAHGTNPEVWLELEDGGVRHDVHPRERWVDPVVVDGQLTGEATYELPGDLPLGYHRLRVRAPGRDATAPVIVTPRWLGLPPHVDRLWGLALQLYSVRSRRSWGVGDLADLADLAAWSGRELGAGFLLVNPLHAAEPTGHLEPSPYLPSSRRFVAPLYLRVEDVPEHAYLGPTARREVDGVRNRLRTDLASAGAIDRDAVWAAKQAALRLVHAVPRSPGREAAYRAFRAEQGAGLEDFATYCALATRHGSDWRAWPEPLRDPRSAEVAAARADAADEVDFWAWLQWALDEQLARTAAAARGAGMPLGVVHDLAVGVHRDGADTWRMQDVLAPGVTVGAPPDPFNQQGQDWSQPPWRPDALAETGYVAYRDLLRTVLRSAGGLRVDHVIGLFRLWWVPEGASPLEGTYVRYDHEALVGILALEAARAGAVVVGEDLGTVEPWVRDYLRERGILGTSVLWFERDAEGRPLAPERWRELCLAAVTVHDLPPTAGYLAGEHVRLRGELGLLDRPLAEELAADAADRDAWLAVLHERGLLREGAGEQEVVEALHRLLTWTPARLLAVSLADAVGDRRTQNQPGTQDEYPNWRVPLTGPDGSPVLLEDVAASPRVRSLARAVEL